MILRFASGRFELLRQVGEGGAGVVFEARDLQTNQLVAVKLLHDGDALAQARFEHEIAVLAELPHPAIVRYIAHGSADDGRQFLVMEWLAGKTADKHRVGAWPVSEVLTLARRIVSGLAFAALRGISHRDIKPANLFLVNEDVSSAKILDFGLARRSSDHQERASTASVLGTPLYMSPEQARGADVLDARTDVFSLGSVLYACLCGRAAFLAPHAAQILEQICSEEPMPIEERAPHVPVRLRSLVQAMMRKDREERPDWRVIAEELSEIAERHIELDAAQPTNADSLAKSLAPRSIAPQRRTRTVDYRIMTMVFVARLGRVSSALEAAVREVADQHGARIEVLPG
ncbi:MAG TPA: serine/threonine-protein kinase, partial [Polyangiales bacterium]|nr:serine/threonine-protein kinase [Polyangiales bacterium]